MWMISRNRPWLAALLLCLAQGTTAQETRSAEPGATPPAARLDDLAWLAGEWRGEGIDGATASETYSAPIGGTIAGHFVQTGNDGVSFYELMVISPVDGSLSYRIKHFDRHLRGWEERDRRVEFPLVATEQDAWFFDGLTIRRLGPDRMLGAVRIRDKDGHRELIFRYKRVDRGAGRRR
jgi:hypothetical protein